MEENQSIDLSKRKFSSRLIVKRALARGWNVTGFSTTPSLFLIQVPGRPKPVKIFSSSPMQTPHAASIFAEDKYITNQLLAAQDIPVPAELLIDDTTSTQDIQEFLESHTPVVVKPLNAGHGQGISMNISDLKATKAAIQNALQFTESGNVLLQQQFNGDDIRVTCIGYEAIDAISRIPASVVGDGTHTVAELIDLTNQSSERGENYSAKLNIIALGQAAEHLGQEELARVPAKKEVVQVIAMSNLGLGGVMREDVLEELPDFIIDTAVKVARIMDLPVCAVDFLVKSWPKPNDTPESLPYIVIEVNACPSLTRNDENSATQQKVIDSYLDLVSQTP